MDGLESATTSVAPTTTAPASATATASETAPAPVSASSSSDSSSSLKDVFREMNPTEIIFGILGAWALFSVIYYYRYNTTMNRAFKNEIENKLDDIQIKLADVTSVMEKDKLTQPQSFDGFYS